MSTFRIEGNAMHIGEGYIKLDVLVDFLGGAGVLSRHGWYDEVEVDEARRDAREDALDEEQGELQARVDSAVDELTYLEHEDPYRYHDDNMHTGAVKWCPDPFCQTVEQTNTVIDILKGA